MRNNAKYKRGISLIVLVITIIVALILVATAVITTTNSIDNANITTFSKDLTEIQEATESYYITNNVMPSVAASTAMNKDELTAIARVQNLFTEELTENNDLDAQFYTIDLAKINVTKAAYGNKQLGENDIFVVSYPSMNVYYPYGLDAKGTTYFSITSKISNVTKIAQNALDNSTTSVTTSGGIKVTKTNGWANKMGVSIEADMAEGETLYMSVSGDPNKLITTTTGKNTFGFNLLSSIVNDLETIKVPTLTLAEADYIEAGTKPLIDRYVDIIKYRDTDVMGKVRIDLSNFSKTLPTITNAALSSYPTMNTVKLTLATTESGIKEVRYEYLTKYTEAGTIDNYYTGITDFDAVYMQGKAKKAKLASDLTTTINAPKNVQAIKVAVIDKAGNINLYTQEIAPRLYIGYSLDSSTKDSLQLTANMFSINGIKTITFSKSLDGTTFTDEQAYTLNTTNNGVTSKQSVPYTNFAVNNVYIKMVAVNYDSTLTETRIVRIALTTSSEDLGYTTTKPLVSDVNKYKKPYIPTGFTYKEGTWDTGLVIEDAAHNEFVWIPVDGTNVPYSKWCITGTPYNDANVSNDTLPTGVTSEADQITNYGGFYVARYEAGNAANVLVSKKSTAVWNNINYTDAKTKAETMYNTASVKSGLVTGTQWDTMMKWIQNSGKSVTNTTTWGNHTDSTSPANVTGYGILQPTGFSVYWKTNNIYDLAGNVWEWTNEVYFTTNRLRRGGDYSNSGSSYPAASRISDNYSSYTSNLVSFRVVLYIL